MIISGCVAVSVILLSTAGFITVRKYVEQDVVAQTRPPRVQFAHRPVWMSDYLHSRLVERIRPDEPASAFDHDLLVRTARKLEQSPWVLRVNQVRRGFGSQAGDTLEVDCEFRAPIALVKWNGSYWLVDNEGVKLPEEYAPADVPRVALTSDGRAVIRIIDGVRNAPPPSGRVWSSPDLQAGLDMIKVLFSQPYAEDVIKIDVTNFQGRDDVREAQVSLVTRYGTEIRWGRPLDATDYFIEVPTSRKLALLQQLHHQYGRLDAGKRWLDVRFDNVTYPQEPTGELARTSTSP